MSDRLSRLAPLTGVVGGALALAGALASNSSPSGSSSGTKVISWYASHHANQKVGDILLAFAVVFLVFFAAAARSYMRRAPGGEGSAALMLGGAVLAAGLLVVGLCVDYALAADYSHLSPSGAQALNSLGNTFLPLPGLFAFYVASGVAVLVSRRLPAWMGWVGIALGIVSVTPAAVAGFFGLVLWPAIVGVVIYLRTREPEASAAVPDPAPA